jgi:hypothetical protein
VDHRGRIKLIRLADQQVQRDPQKHFWSQRMNANKQTRKWEGVSPTDYRRDAKVPSV